MYVLVSVPASSYISFPSAPATLWPSGKACCSDDVSGFGKVSGDRFARSLNVYAEVRRRAGEEPERISGTQTKRWDVKAK